MGTWIYFREGKAAKGEEMGATVHMPCPLKQWFSTCHCTYGLPRLWDPLPYLPMFTYYKRMKCNAKCRIWGGFDGHWSGVTQGHQQCHHWIRAHTTSYLTLIETMHLSCTVFEKQRAILTYPPAFLSILGDPFEFRQGLWYQKTSRVSRQSCASIWVVPRLATLTQYWCEDTQTDRHTHITTAYTMLT